MSATAKKLKSSETASEKEICDKNLLLISETKEYDKKTPCDMNVNVFNFGRKRW